MRDADAEKSQQSPANDFTELRYWLWGQYLPRRIVIPITLLLPVIQGPCRINGKAVLVTGDRAVEGIAYFKVEVGVTSRKGSDLRNRSSLGDPLVNDCLLYTSLLVTVLDDVILEQYTLGDHLITGLEDVLSERTLEVTGDQELADYLATVLGKA